MTDDSMLFCARPYDLASPLHRSDQIMVPQSIWTSFDRGHIGTGPIFVMVEEGCMGRLRPATTEDGLDADSMCVPEWMWTHLGGGVTAEEERSGLWVFMTQVMPPTVRNLTLRPHRHASLMSLDEPVATLAAQIMGEGHGGWGSLTDGIMLDLPCGRFDILGLTDTDGNEIHAGCILDVDIDLDLRPALDYVEPLLPVRAPTPTPSPPCTLLPPQPAATAQKTNGFVPFSGIGHRLGRS